MWNHIQSWSYTQRLAASTKPEDLAARFVAQQILLCTFIVALGLTTLLSWARRGREGSNKVARAEQSEAATVATPSKPLRNGQVQLPSAEQTSLLIRKRRSIFTKDLSGAPVARGVVEDMLEAANWAPTHGKTEPWRFVILGKQGIQDFITTMIEAVGDTNESSQSEGKVAKLESKRGKLGGVAWAIVICFKRQAGEKLMPEWEELAATAAAVQNMHLMATALGAAGYWTSWGPEEARESPRVKTWLGLEPEDRCIGVFLLGASERAEGYKANRGPIGEKVTWRP